MLRVRFSLMTIAGFIAFVAVACAALTNASPRIASIAWSVTLLWLAIVSVGATVAPRPRRAAWLGMALFGWLYVAIIAGPWTPRLTESLPTAALLNRSAQAMQKASDDSVRIEMIEELEMIILGSQSFSTPATKVMNPFISIGHAVWTLLLTFLGGIIGLCVSEKPATSSMPKE